MTLRLRRLFGWKQPGVVLGGLAAGLAWAVPGDTAANSRAASPVPSLLDTARPLYSQHHEEVIIRHFFGDQRGGTFVDVGCASPVANSNTYYLEARLGWTGVGVDALPEFASSWQKKRKGSRFVNYIVTDHAGAAEPFFRVQTEYRGVSSIERPTRAPGGAPVQVREIMVPTITLSKLLDDLALSKLDLLSIDIEGAEPLALAGFDIDRFKPRLVVIEAKPKNQAVLADYFAGHGYERIDDYAKYDTVNYYYKPKDAR